MALTGYYKTFVRPRQHRPLSMLKYDPVGTFPVFVAIHTTWFAEDLGAGVSGESWIWAVEEKLDSRKRRIERGR